MGIKNMIILSWHPLHIRHMDQVEIFAEEQVDSSVSLDNLDGSAPAVSLAD